MCVCVLYTYLSAHSEVSGQLVVVAFLFLPYGIQELDSGCQAWQQASLRAESSFWASCDSLISFLRDYYVVFCRDPEALHAICSAQES